MGFGFWTLGLEIPQAPSKQGEALGLAEARRAALGFIHTGIRASGAAVHGALGFGFGVSGLGVCFGFVGGTRFAGGLSGLPTSNFRI